MILDGKKVSKILNSNIKKKISDEKIKPGLAVIIVGDRKDSLTYVNMKKKTCENIGILSRVFHMSESVTTENIIIIINMLNDDKDINGILVQLPLPKHMDEEKILTAINIEKDVDGFHATNMGNLAMKNREALFIPCTPLGCIKLIDEYSIDIKGKNVVVIGKSNIIGLPIALMLSKRNATVTMCDIFTQNIQNYTKNADIIVSACGQANMINSEWIKSGCSIIDIGINHINDSDNPDKTKIVGDVDFDSVKDIVSYITPVPGGVGPMTISMLIENTYKAYYLQNKNK